MSFREHKKRTWVQIAVNYCITIFMLAWTRGRPRRSESGWSHLARDAARVERSETRQWNHARFDKQLPGWRQTIELALGWAVELKAFRAGTDDVNHSTFGRGVSRKWLGDFVGYADAMLMSYAATGDEVWLEDGERVLRRAIELFNAVEQQPVTAARI